MPAESYAGFSLRERLDAHAPDLDRWRAESLDGPAEIYLGPLDLLARARALPAWGPFPEVRAGHREGQTYVVVPGRIEESLPDLAWRLGPGPALAFAWHIAAVLSELHERGGAHGALHADQIGIDPEGFLVIRPALAADLTAEPDPAASAQDTDCLLLGELLARLDLRDLEDDLGTLSLIIEGLRAPRARLRITPARAARQSLSALVARNPDWERILCDNLGKHWGLDQDHRPLLPEPPARRPVREPVLPVAPPPRPQPASFSTSTLFANITPAPPPARIQIPLPPLAAAPAPEPEPEPDTLDALDAFEEEEVTGIHLAFQAEKALLVDEIPATEPPPEPEPAPAPAVEPEPEPTRSPITDEVVDDEVAQILAEPLILEESVEQLLGEAPPPIPEPEPEEVVAPEPQEEDVLVEEDDASAEEGLPEPEESPVPAAEPTPVPEPSTEEAPEPEAAEVVDEEEPAPEPEPEPMLVEPEHEEDPEEEPASEPVISSPAPAPAHMRSPLEESPAAPPEPAPRPAPEKMLAPAPNPPQAPAPAPAPAPRPAPEAESVRAAKTVVLQEDTSPVEVRAPVMRTPPPKPESKPKVAAKAAAEEEDGAAGAPRWAGVKGVTNRTEREQELGQGKWTETGRSAEEIRQSMPSSPTRELDMGQERSMWPLYAALTLLLMAGMGWLWQYGLGMLGSPTPVEPAPVEEGPPAVVAPGAVVATPEAVDVVQIDVQSGPPGRVTFDGIAYGQTPTGVPLPPDEGARRLCVDTSCREVTRGELTSRGAVFLFDRR